jgi:hypothetical protein
MKYLKKSTLTSIFLFFHLICHSQSHASKVILIIDNKIITQRIDMNFYSNNSIVFNYVYEIGKELVINKEIFNDNNIHLQFNYQDNSKKSIKNYKYNFEFTSGWLENTNYIIVRIYNLDKKEFKRAFCHESKEYAIEIQNQVYYQAAILCKDLKEKF